MKQTTSKQVSVLLRIFGLAGIASGLIAAIPGLVELIAPMIVGYPDKPAFIASTTQVQLTVIGFFHLFKSLGFLSVLYGVFFTGTKRGSGLRIMLAVATAGALWYGGYWIWMTHSRQFSFAFVAGGLWYQWVAPVVFGIAVLRARQLTKTLGILLIVTGLINSFIPIFGLAGGQLVQGTLWSLIGITLFIKSFSTSLFHPLPNFQQGA